MRDRHFHLGLTGVFLVVAAASAAGMHLLDITVRPVQLPAKLAPPAVALAGAWVYRRRGADRLADAMTAVFWMGMLSTLHVFPMFVAGRVPGGFHDADLAAADAALGVRTPDVMAAVGRAPAVRRALEVVYESLVFLMAAAVILPPLAAARTAAKEYLVACTVSVCVAFPVFAAFQAQGPWVYYGYDPAIGQDAYLRTYAALKAEPHYVMDLGYSRGLITFPSFHTVLAVLAGVALWAVRYARWVGAGWAALIAASTVTTGTHYVVDVLGGLGVAAVAVGAARGFTRVGRRLADRVSGRGRTGPAATE